MKILFVNYEFPPIGAGGGNANWHIACQMAREGHEVSVLTSRFATLKHRENMSGVDVIRIPALRARADKCTIPEMILFLLSSLVFGIYWHFKLKPQVVVAFFSIPCGPLALLLKLLFGTPFIVALRGGDVPGFLPEQLWFYHKITAWLTRLIWRQSHAITVNSRGLGDLAQKFHAHPRLKVIPNGVEEDFFYVRPPDAKKARIGELRILAVGRLSVQKHVERLVLSVARLRKQKKQIWLDVVGDGPLRGELENLARQLKLLDQGIRFLGWMNREELKGQYRQADVFALASDFEGMPNVVLEAMASSLAVVATAAPGTVELVEQGQNGYLIPLNELTQFDEFFMDLLDKPATLSRMQNHSHKKAKDFTWSGVSLSYLELCQEACD